MSKNIIQVSDDFWNIRGSFRVGGVINIGTHCSLIRRSNGKFVLLDSYPLRGAVKRQVFEATNNGNDVEAVLNVHPFHTVHVATTHKQFPNAKLYGTQRHRERAPSLPWEDLLVEDEALHKIFKNDFEFSIPRGVDFISANESVHFSSVMVYHPASKTIHVDDTIMYLKLPLHMRALAPIPRIAFHPTLAMALEKRSGAAADFRTWAEEIIDDWGDAENLCTAHTATLLGRDNHGRSIKDRLSAALKKVSGKLRSHQRRYG